MDPNKYSHQMLSKFLAYAGIASRRNSEKLILEGRISVNGLVVTNVATKVSEADHICFDNTHISNQLEQSRIWIYHKPVGEICSDSAIVPTPVGVLSTCRAIKVSAFIPYFVFFESMAKSIYFF